MREVVVRLPRAAVEDVLDRLLLIAPSGVHESPAGRHVDLKLRGDDLPTPEDLKRAIGRWPHRVSEHEVSDDWRERRAADYVPDLIAGRLVVRPTWAPPSTAEIEIALGESSAFGGGAHPTTRTCLELLLGLPTAGGFADLGCGSGVLAVLAARLGWEPVVAIDVEPASVRSTLANSQHNAVTVEARVADLSVEAPPTTDAFAANVPATLHRALAANFPEPVPRIGILSGFAPSESEEVSEAYSRRGLAERTRIDVHGWTVLYLTGRDRVAPGR